MTYATSNTTKRTHFQCMFFVLRFETDNFKQSRYVGILIQAIIWRVYLCYDKSDK